MMLLFYNMEFIFLFIFGFCNGFAVITCKFRILVACNTSFRLKLCYFNWQESLNLDRRMQ